METDNESRLSAVREWFRMNNCIRAIVEVFFVGIVSLLPLFMSAIFADIKGGGETFKICLKSNIANGELFLFSVSFIASALFIASDDLPWRERGIPGKKTIVLISAVTLAISTTFIILQRGGTFGDPHAVTKWSSWVFASSLIILTWACTFRNKQVNPRDLIKQETDDLIRRFAQAQGVAK